MTKVRLTPEQQAEAARVKALARIDAAAAAVLKKAQEREAKRAEADEAKRAEKEKAAAEKAAAAEAKAKAKEAAKQATADKKAEKEKAKAQRQAEKEAAKGPVVNGVRRPADESKCGAAWVLMDRMSAERERPVAIADLLIVALGEGMNENMVRSNYAAWRKFHNVTGRIFSDADVAYEQAIAAAKQKASDAAAALNAPAEA